MTLSNEVLPCCQRLTDYDALVQLEECREEHYAVLDGIDLVLREAKKRHLTLLNEQLSLRQHVLHYLCSQALVGGAANREKQRLFSNEIL